MSAAPFTPHPAPGPASDPAFGWASARVPCTVPLGVSREVSQVRPLFVGAGQGAAEREARQAAVAAHLARLRAEVPQVGFVFDGRRWWAVYGRQVTMFASDPDLLLASIREAIHRATVRTQVSRPARWSGQSGWSGRLGWRMGDGR